MMMPVILGAGAVFLAALFVRFRVMGILREQKEQFEREQKALQSRYEEREAKQEAGFQAQRQEQETLKRALFTASANVDLYVQEAETLSMKEKLRVIREENRKILEKLHGES